jgi:hypothetical protein
MASQVFAGMTVKLYTQTDGQPSGYRDPKSYGGEFAAVLSGTSTYNTEVIDNANVLAHYSSKATTTVNGQSAFETFCIEVNQTFSPGTSYNAQAGSVVVPGGPVNYVTLGTAYLYSQFAQGILSGYNYSTSGTGRELSSDELQDAIWYLQGEINGSGTVTVSGSEISSVNDSLYTFTTSDPFLTLAEQAIFGKTGSTQLTAIQANAKGAYDVLALNLSSTSNGKTVYNQDQLVYCPVPEPATFAAGALLLFPLGWSAIRALRKKVAAQSELFLIKGTP